ncbi:MAG: hypothetical protein AB4038_01595 [Prochloraceae cyanobacterium]
MFKFQSEVATFTRCPDVDNQNSVPLESGLSEHFRLRANFCFRQLGQPQTAPGRDYVHVLR